MKIFVPSTHRWNDVASGPLKQMTKRAAENIFYVVPPDQKEHYVDRIKRLDNGCIAAVLTPHEKGIAKTREWIGRFCEENGISRFMMLDDDINFVQRVDTEKTQLRISSPVDVEGMLEHVEQSLMGHAHVAVSARGGNNNLGVGDPMTLRSYNTRTLRALAYRTDVFLMAEHGRVDVMEDFDVNLQILKMGYTNCQLGFWAQDQKMTNAPGGCSTYRTHDLHERSARKLAELHPGIVSLREKKNKTDAAGFGTRLEVTIQWKKAYQIGRSRLENR